MLGTEPGRGWRVYLSLVVVVVDVIVAVIAVVVVVVVVGVVCVCWEDVCVREGDEFEEEESGSYGSN